ncbi:MAG: hypothetical protein QOD84_620, partial [Acidobacteriaceae bacterium]
MKLKWMTIAGPAIVLSILFYLSRPAKSFLFEGSGSGTTFTPTAWSASSFPLQWKINPTRSTAIVGNTPVTNVIMNSFTTWTNAPNTQLSVASPT